MPAVPVSSEVLSYTKALQDIKLFQKLGPLHVKVVGKEFVQCSLLETMRAYSSAALAIISNHKCNFQKTYELLRQKTETINSVHHTITDQSTCLKQYFTAAKVIEQWNKQPQNAWERWQTSLLQRAGWNGDLHIDYSDAIPITVPQLPAELFTCSIINIQKLPLVISPRDPQIPFDTFVEWLEQNQDITKTLLDQYGAILFKNFPVQTSQHFSAVLKAAIGKNLLDYLGGEGSRDTISQGVYTSTKAPEWAKIPLHNELSCTNSPASYICFDCDVPPPPGGGQTTLGSTRELTRLLRKNPEVWNLYADKKLKYISRHPPAGHYLNKINPTHKTVEETFQTNDKEKIQAICDKKGYKCKFIGDWVKVIRLVPAMRPDPDHPDQQLFLNQAHLYHTNPKLTGGWINYILWHVLYFRAKTRNYSIKFEDGTEIPQKVIYQIYDALDKVTVKPEWKRKGDVLIVDNIRTMHGKLPHKKLPNQADRRILTSLIP